jgi:alkylation response protein AidB-like acyl-CoA dehydrogenase
MDFNPSDEQRMLADSVGRFVQDRYDLDRRKAYLSGPASYCPENWRMLAELGITALVLPAGLNGLDGTPADVAVVMEQLGRGLVVEPVIPSAVLAARILAASPAHAETAAATAAGEHRIAVALAAPPASRGGSAAALTCEAADGGCRLTGTATLAVQAAGADAVIFSCAGPQGFAAFVFAPDETPGIARRDYRLLDGSLASEFRFDGAAVPAGARLEITSEDWTRAKAWADIAACAEMLGIMGRSLDETAEHLRTRKQFGAALGTFQAPQHRMARMLFEYEKARALLHGAAMASGEDELVGAIRDCRRYIGAATIEVGEACVHLHGGMGVTDEVFVSNALRRLNFLRHFVSGLAECPAAGMPPR